MAIIPDLPLVKVMLLSQDVNGILLPIILIYVLKIINDREVMGEHVNGRVYNTIAWGFSVGADRALGDAGRCRRSSSERPAGDRPATSGPAGGAGPARQSPSNRSGARGSTCTSTSVLGMQARMSSSMCSAMSCASVTVRSGVDHHVQVDVPAAAGAPGAQLVVAADDVAAVLAHAAADLLELLVGQRLVEQHAGGLHHQLVAGLDDEHGDGDGGDRVEVRPAGELDEQQADGHAERRVDVGEQVGGVGLERGRLRAPRDRVEHAASRR